MGGGKRKTGIRNCRTALDGESCSSREKNFGLEAWEGFDTLKMRF
jgi:hypothetical protein